MDWKVPLAWGAWARASEAMASVSPLAGAFRRAAVWRGWDTDDLDRLLGQATSGDLQHLFATLRPWVHDIDGTNRGDDPAGTE